VSENLLGIRKGWNMKKSYFPVFMDIGEKKILVVGGGNIASRRVKTLLAFAENITVIAPEVTEFLSGLESEGRIVCLHREYRPEDLEGMDMILAATDDRRLNQSIARLCEGEKEKGRDILVNIADNRELCDFYFPSVIQKEGVVIGINSGGACPGKVKAVRKKIEDIFWGREDK